MAEVLFTLLFGLCISLLMVPIAILPIQFRGNKKRNILYIILWLGTLGYCAITSLRQDLNDFSPGRLALTFGIVPNVTDSIRVFHDSLLVSVIALVIYVLWIIYIKPGYRKKQSKENQHDRPLETTRTHTNQRDTNPCSPLMRMMI